MKCFYVQVFATCSDSSFYYFKQYTLAIFLFFPRKISRTFSIFNILSFLQLYKQNYLQMELELYKFQRTPRTISKFLNVVVQIVATDIRGNCGHRSSHYLFPKIRNARYGNRMCSSCQWLPQNFRNLAIRWVAAQWFHEMQSWAKSR